VATLATLKARIATEINRGDLTTPIADAITTAIRFYRSKRFEFNEKQTSFNTTASQAAYNTTVVVGTTNIPDDIGEIDSIRATVNGRLYLLEPMNFAELQELSTTTTTRGQPTRFAWYAQTLHLYPIPDATYAILISHQQRQDAPANDADGTTVWTNDAEPLIRARVKKMICRDITFDADGFARAQQAEDEAREMLENESRLLQDQGGLAAND
jgi:hypothetical protein